MSELTFVTKVLAYDDLPRTNNPKRVGIDRLISMTAVPVENDQTQKIPLDPGATVTVIDGTRSTSIDNTTAFTMTLSPLDPTIYRFTNSGGTAPAFRVDRGLATSTHQLVLTVNQNQTLTMDCGSAGLFGALQSGDIVWIPGITTGDPLGQFNTLNEGTWYVLATGSNVIVLGRAVGSVFNGFTETVTPAANSAVQGFSATGVQAGDTLDISAGFSTNTQRAFEITTVNPAWVEVRSTLPLGLETATPTATGFVIYTAAKRYVGVESEEEIVLQFNGGTDTTNRVTPLRSGSARFAGVFQKFGTTWKLVLVNRGTVRHTVTVTSAE